jgi:hypothetical protein
MTALACCVLHAVDVTADSDDVDKQILGAWKLECTTPDGVARTPIVIVGRQYEEYVAWYVGDDQPEAFKDVQLKDDTLVGTINPKVEPNVTVTLEAKLKAENECEGTGKFRSADGKTGSWNFTGKRIDLSEFDEVMTWKLSFVSPDEKQHSPTVTVVEKDGELYAWYSGKDHELPAVKISVDGDRVEMKMTAESPEGAKVDVTFRGTVDGDNVAGKVEFRVEGESGSFAFTGKRTS